MDSQRKQTILIVDDSEMNRAILAEMLGTEYTILEAENGRQAIALMQRHITEISLVLLDVNMPEMDGFSVLKIMHQQQWNEDIPVIMISAENRTDYIEEAYALGVTDFIGRPFDAPVVRHRVINTLLLYAKQKRLAEMVVEQIRDKMQQSSLMIDILSHIVEFRNGESGQHVLHIRTLTELLLRQLNGKDERYQFSPSDITRISTASAIHDVGKIAIPEEILNKPGRLTEEEFEIIKTHSMVGAKMLDALTAHQDEPLVRTAYEICRWHHERYDGRGYPDKLAGDDIPIAAQVVALADVYDALTSERVYKKAFSHEEAVHMILDGQCGVFNPILIECLQETSEQIKTALRNSNWKQAMPINDKTIVEEVLHNEALTVSGRTLQTLELERMKHQFFSSVTDEIQFEYTLSPPILTLSASGAKKLGIPEIIVDPMHNEALSALIDMEAFRSVAEMVRNTSVEKPVVEYEGFFKYRDGQKRVRMLCRAIWSGEEAPCYLGTVGKVIEISE